ncbi:MULTISPECIES: histidine kinase N-terminal 7TM domain-containing protein [Salinibaculum]|uniref:histidine kinase N-terminal 7TM domain-containing protein n=1 Tax=Salinibaculum TaxID=2732368 RepID=UPI0030D1EA7F
MSRLLAWPFLLSLLAGLGSLGLARQLWRVRDRPGARWFFVTLVGQTLFCLAYAGALLVSGETLRYGLEVLAVVSLHWIGVPFLGFALEYTGRSNLVDTWYFRSLFAFPLAATVLLPFTAGHGLFWTDFALDPAFGVVGATYTTEPLLFVTVLGGTGGASIGALLLLETFLDYGPLYRTEAIAVALSPLPPALGIFAWLFQFGPVPELNLTAVLFIPHVLLDGYAFVRSDMFEFHPATRRAAERSALDDLPSPVFVVDEQGRIVETNGRARAVLSNGEDPVTRPVEDVLGVSVSLTDDQRLGLRHDGQHRTYRLRPAPLTDSGDNLVGYTLVLQDITDEVRREQRLEVLNRVLRHNLRNDMTVVKGHLGVAMDADDATRRDDALRTADDKAEELIATSEKARNVAEILRNVAGDPIAVDVYDLCADVTESARDSAPGATVHVEGDSPARVETDPDVLAAVVRNLVENAVSHGGDAPTVTVTVERRAPDLVCVTVADDGPGIPDVELETLQSGTETDLQHGSGLGLWVVRWGAELLGREVSFETGADGTTATVCVPDQGGD